jgi:hypothetical protein
MTHTFRYSLLWRIVTFILGIPIAIALTWVAGTPFYGDKLNYFKVITITLPAGVAALYIVSGFIEVLRCRLSIGTDFISYKAIWKTRTLLFSEIDGFNEVEKRIVLVPKKGVKKKKIQLHRYFENADDIEKWARVSFRNISEDEANEELKEVLDDTDHGATETIRLSKLKSAKRVAWICNFLCLVVACWVGFYPYSYSIAVSLSMIAPLILILIVYRYNGMIFINEQTGSKVPSVVYGIIFSTIPIGLRGLIDFDILVYNSTFWINVVGLFLCFLMLLVAVSKDLRPAFRMSFFLNLIGFSVLGFFYAIGSIIVINCHFDPSKPKITETHIISKERDINKMVYTAKIIVDKWSDVEGSEKISITRAEFRVVEPGQKVGVALHEGLLGTPWYHSVLD